MNPIRSLARAKGTSPTDLGGATSYGMKPRLVVIVGPTASGKSDLAIKLAQKFKGEIISADSRQVYRGMDIGTGKVLRDKTLPKSKFKILNLKFPKNIYYSSGVPHHLIDVVSPKTNFTVANFKSRAQKAIADIVRHGKFPIIVGGTGQYIDTLVYNLALPEVLPNYKLRAQFGKLTVEQLFEKLKKLDPERAKNIDRHNPRRLIRALEIVMTTGQPVGPLKKESPYEVFWLGLNPKDLDKRITTRLSARLKQGMLAEVKKLRANGISWQRLYDFGLEYRWVSQYLQDKISKEEMASGLEQAIRQYSKRQMTWFKRNKEIHWVKNLDEATGFVRDFLVDP